MFHFMRLVEKEKDWALVAKRLKKWWPSTQVYLFDPHLTPSAHFTIALTDISMSCVYSRGSTDNRFLVWQTMFSPHTCLPTYPLKFCQKNIVQFASYKYTKMTKYCSRYSSETHGESLRVSKSVLLNWHIILHSGNAVMFTNSCLKNIVTHSHSYCRLKITSSQHTVR